MKSLISFCILFFLSKSLYSQHNDSIRSFLSSYQYQEALDLVNISLDDHPKDATLYKLKGYALKGLLKYSEAVKAFDTAVAYDSTDFQSYIELAQCFKTIGFFDKALKKLHTAQSLKPANFFIKTEIAGLYLLKEDFISAKNLYLALYRTDTTNIILLRNLAKCYDALEEPDSSVLFFSKVLAIVPYDVQSVIKLANWHINELQFAKVIETTTFYRAFDKNNLKVNRLHAYGYFLNNKFKQSIAYFRNCIVNGDTSHFVFRYMGLCYFKVERYDSAKYYLEQAFLMDTTSAQVCYPLGISCEMSGLKKESVYYLRKALELVSPAPKFHSELLQHLCNAYNLNRMYQQGLDALLTAKQITPKDTLLKFRIALQYHDHLKNTKMAVKFYKEFLKTRPPQKSGTPPKKTENVVSYYQVAERCIKELETQK